MSSSRTPRASRATGALLGGRRESRSPMTSASEEARDHSEPEGVRVDVRARGRILGRRRRRKSGGRHRACIRARAREGLTQCLRPPRVRRRRRPPSREPHPAPVRSAGHGLRLRGARLLRTARARREAPACASGNPLRPSGRTSCTHCHVSMPGCGLEGPTNLQKYREETPGRRDNYCNDQDRPWPLRAE